MTEQVAGHVASVWWTISPKSSTIMRGNLVLYRIYDLILLGFWNRPFSRLRRPCDLDLGWPWILYRSICLIDLYPFHYWACGSVEFHCERTTVQIRRSKISQSSEPSGIHMGGHGCSLFHDSSRRYLLLSIVTIQSELWPLWTDLRPPKIRVKKRRLNQIQRAMKRKRNRNSKKWPDEFICPYYMNH